MVFPVCEVFVLRVMVKALTKASLSWLEYRAAISDSDGLCSNALADIVNCSPLEQAN
jgi:hypothetical protein